MINTVTSDFICKVVEAKIRGEAGYFYGSVSSLTEKPSGEGVFVTDDEWIHFGRVRDDGKFFEGERLSVTLADKINVNGEHHIVNSKLAPNGAFVEKIKAFNSLEVESGFYVSGKWKAYIIQRFNFSRLGPENWLALSRVKFVPDPGTLYNPVKYKDMKYLEAIIKNNQSSEENKHLRRRIVRVGRGGLTIEVGHIDRRNKTSKNRYIFYNLRIHND